jgi:hypothetical protein
MEHAERVVAIVLLDGVAKIAVTSWLAAVAAMKTPWMQRMIVWTIAQVMALVLVVFATVMEHGAECHATFHRSARRHVGFQMGSAMVALVRVQPVFLDPSVPRLCAPITALVMDLVIMDRASVLRAGLVAFVTVGLTKLPCAIHLAANMASV